MGVDVFGCARVSFPRVCDSGLWCSIVLLWDTRQLKAAYLQSNAFLFALHALILLYFMHSIDKVIP